MRSEGPGKAMESGSADIRSLARVEESGEFVWPWRATRGLAVISGAHGGGGGGGALCLEGLNVYGAGGGEGGEGGEATLLEVGDRRFVALGGNGGGGGGGGGLLNGEPVTGKTGAGCVFGESAGGTGGRAARASGRTTADGGDGGAGFPGEAVLAEIEGLALGETLSIRLGAGGAGGEGGEGFERGNAGTQGSRGYVLLVPLLGAPQGGGR